MAEFVGKYKFDKDDGNFDEFLKEMKVGMITRKLASGVKPTIEISVQDDGTIVVKTSSTFKSSSIEFKLGEEFDEKRMDDVVCKSTVTQEGNKLIQIQKGTPEVEIIREFTADKLITTCKCNKTVCVREYKKLP